MNQKEKEAQQLIVKEVLKANKLLLDHFEKFIIDTKGSAIPINYIRTTFKIFNESYEKGAS
jgi:hypothetical protein